MEIDSQNDLLIQIASGATPQKDTWLDLRRDILERLDKIAHDAFPIPHLPPPPTYTQLPDARLLSPIPSSSPLEPLSQDANKENAPTNPALPEQAIEPGALPKQIADMLADIKNRLLTFESYPPHTVQRLAELILSPRAHYKALASYLHAVDRVVQVTSGTDTYPLPPAIPDMSTLTANGDDAKDPAATVSWGNPASAAVGSDEALGGALLTPIPWLTRRSPESSGEDTPGAQIHSESTETIDGPNGMGSIETVSVSVNGVPSTGHTRGVTQGELLRQEQRAGVVPVSQLTRAHEAHAKAERQAGEEDDEDRSRDQESEEDDEVPHARGPEEIGVGDTGLQAATTSFVGGAGLEMQGIDLEAAVGRKHEEEHDTAPPAGEPADTADAVKTTEAADAPPSPSSSDNGSVKREAEQTLEPDSTKKVKEDVDIKDAEDGPKQADAADTKSREGEPESMDADK